MKLCPNNSWRRGPIKAALCFRFLILDTVPNINPQESSPTDISDKLTPGGLLPYMGYIGMCRCEGYGFQAVYSRIGYINQSIWV